MINYILTGVYEQFDINKMFIEYKKAFPEKFIDNMRFSACYGTFQHCTWDGGRAFFTGHPQASYEDIVKIRDYYKENNIPVRLIFTNNMIEEKHLYDRFANLTAELCEDENNEIVVNSELLENYIRTKYPKYKIISSTTKCLTKPADAIKELDEKNYYMVCLDYNMNHNFNLLKSIKHKEKIELLVNAICPTACPYRKEHYKLNSISNISYGSHFCVPMCDIQSKNIAGNKNFPNTITVDEIINTYEPMGICNFKIEGRAWIPTDVIITYVYYMIKPEYQLQVLADLINK